MLAYESATTPSVYYYDFCKIIQNCHIMDKKVKVGHWKLLAQSLWIKQKQNKTKQKGYQKKEVQRFLLLTVNNILLKDTFTVRKRYAYFPKPKYRNSCSYLFFTIISIKNFLGISSCGLLEYSCNIIFLRYDCVLVNFPLNF